MSETYRKIKALYYDIFPQEKRLVFGCKVLRNSIEGQGIILDKTGGTNDRFVRIVFPSLLGHTDLKAIQVREIASEDILGEDIDIRELLMLSNYLGMQMKGLGDTLFIITEDVSVVVKYYSKLSEQSEATLNALYNLLKEKAGSK